MATMIPTVDSETAFGSASNLNSLPDGEAKPLGEVNNSTNYRPSAKIHLIINLPTSGLSDFGIVEIYLLSCLGTAGTATNWSDGIDGDASSDQSSSVNTARLIKQFKADPSMHAKDINWVCNDISLLTDQDNVMVGDLPPHWSLLVFNKSGAAFQATGHTATHRMVTYGT